MGRRRPRMVSVRRRLIALALLLTAGLPWPWREGTAGEPPPAWRALGTIHPRISPDGATIAVSYLGAIWTVPRAGGVLRRLTSGPGFDVQPAWSPEGTKIAYLSSRNFDEGQLRVIAAADGSQLAAGPAGSGRLYFHPDGRRILGLFRGLAWLELESGKVTPLFDPPRGPAAYCLSPDGGSIAYATNFDRPGEQTGNDGPRNELWKVSASGGDPKSVFEFPARIYDLWLPSQRGIVLSSDLGGAHKDLWQVPLEGQRLFK